MISGWWDSCSNPAAVAFEFNTPTIGSNMPTKIRLAKIQTPDRLVGYNAPQGIEVCLHQTGPQNVLTCLGALPRLTKRGFGVFHTLQRGLLSVMAMDILGMPQWDNSGLLVCN